MDKQKEEPTAAAKAVTELKDVEESGDTWTELEELTKQNDEEEDEYAWTVLKSEGCQGPQIEIQVESLEWDPEAGRRVSYWLPIPSDAANAFIQHMPTLKKFSYVYEWREKGYGTMIIEGQIQVIEFVLVFKVRCSPRPFCFNTSVGLAF